MSFTEDQDEFLDTSEFATPALIGTTQVVGIYTAEDSDSFEVEGTVPTWLVKESDVNALAIVAGTLVNMAAEGKLFYVRELQPDGTGWVLLRLEDVTP